MTTETKPRRGRRFLKILLLLLVLMLLVLVFLPTLASTGLGKSWVEGRIAGSLHRDVTIGEFDAGWSSGLSFTDLSVANPAGFSEQPLFSAKTMLLKPALMDAISGSVDMDFVLRDAVIRVEKDANGKTNLDGMMASEEGDGKPPEKASEPSPLRLSVVIENLSLIHVDLTQAAGQQETRVEDIRLTLDLGGDEPAKLAGVIEATVKRIALANGLESTDVKLSGKGENGVFAIEEMSLPLGGGQVVARGEMDLRDASKFRSTIEMTNVRLSRGFPLLAYVLPIFELDSGGTAAGTLNAKVSVAGSRFDLESIRRDLTGGGEIRVTDGSVSGNSILTQAMAMAGESGAWKFDEIVAGFNIEGGRVHTPKVKLGGGDLRLRLAGSVGLDGAVDYTLGLRPKGAQWKQVRQLLGDEDLIPVKITGKLGAIQVEQPDPAAILQQLMKKGPGGLIEGLLGR